VSEPGPDQLSNALEFLKPKPAGTIAGTLVQGKVNTIVTPEKKTFSIARIQTDEDVKCRNGSIYWDWIDRRLSNT
jgi:hypothetical protein